MKTILASLIVLGVFASFGGKVVAREVWVNQVILRDPVARAQNEATPMHLRPYRPLHFYGNTVRRRYHRGTPLPSRKDFVNTVRALASSARNRK